MALQLSNLRQSAGIARLGMLLLSLVGLIFIIVAIWIHGTDDFVGYESVTYDAISLVSFAWTILWSISAICVLIFHGSYHPGIDIGLDIVGWGLAWGWGVMVILNAAERNYPGDCMYEDPGFCPTAKALMASEILAGVLAWIYGACHLWMIVAAIKTLMAKGRSPHRQRKSLDSSSQERTTV